MRKYCIDKNYVLGTISSKNLTVTDFCKKLGCSRVNLYMALNRSYRAPRSLFINKVIKELDLIDNLVWVVE